MNTLAWLHKSGLWLRVSYSTPFGFHKVEAYLEQDIHKAYIAPALPKFTDGTKTEDYTPVPAWTERKVFIGVPPAPPKEFTAEQMMSAYLDSATAKPETTPVCTELKVLGLSEALHNRLYKAGYMTVESILNTGSAKLLETTPLSNPQYTELYMALHKGGHCLTGYGAPPARPKINQLCHVSNLGLPVKIVHTLQAEGVNTVWDLQKLGVTQIKRIPGIGVKAFKAVAQALAEKGYDLTEYGVRCD